MFRRNFAVSSVLLSLFLIACSSEKSATTPDAATPPSSTVGDPSPQAPAAPAKLTKLTKPLPELELRRYQACHDDSNCVRVDNGCCDCANNGATIAVNRDYEKEFRSRFDCSTTMCTQRAGDCNFKEPVCIHGLCKLGKRGVDFPHTKKKKRRRHKR